MHHRTIRIMLTALTLTWLGSLGALWAGQDLLIFPASLRPAAADSGYEAYRWQPVGDPALQGWHLPPQTPQQTPQQATPPPTIVFFGGNGEDIARSLPRLAAWRDRTGAGIVAVNYRGYGNSQGRPSQTALIDDADRILAALWQQGIATPARTVLIGRSLGSGVVMQMAARHDLAGLVLITPFDSVRALVARRLPFIPVRHLLRHPFDSAAIAPHISEPALIIYAEQDTVVPHPHTDALVAAFNRDIGTMRIPGTRHSAYEGPDDNFIAALRDFLATLAPVPLSKAETGPDNQAGTLPRHKKPPHGDGNSAPADKQQ